MNNINVPQRIDFFTPVIWESSPLALLALKKPYMQIALNLLYHAAEFYASRGKNYVWVRLNKNNTCYEVNFESEVSPLLQRPLYYIRAATVLSLALACGRFISYAAVKIGKENTPFIFKYIHTPLRGFIAHVIGLCVLAGALTALVLTAVKIAIRCRNEIVVLPSGSLANSLSGRPEDNEVD